MTRAFHSKVIVVDACSQATKSPLADKYTCLADFPSSLPLSADSVGNSYAAQNSFTTGPTPKRCAYVSKYICGCDMYSLQCPPKYEAHCAENGLSK